MGLEYIGICTGKPVGLGPPTRTRGPRVPTCHGYSSRTERLPPGICVNCDSLHTNANANVSFACVFVFVGKREGWGDERRCCVGKRAHIAVIGVASEVGGRGRRLHPRRVIASMASSEGQGADVHASYWDRIKAGRG